MFLSVVILGRFTTETHAMAPLHRHRHAAIYTTPRDLNRRWANATDVRPTRYFRHVETHVNSRWRRTQLPQRWIDQGG